MSTGTRALMTGLSILLLAAGCSQLENDPVATVQSLDNEACETCHPLHPKTKDHLLHLYDSTMEAPLPLKCQDCHKGYDDSLGWVEPAYHRNGRIDTSQAECDFCHRYRKSCSDTFNAECHVSPPTTSDKVIRVHRHVAQQDMKCGECHKGYDVDKRLIRRELHDNGRNDVVFDVLGKPGFSAPPRFSNDSCYNLYCHGAFTNGGKEAVAVNDTKPQGVPDQCNFCHELNGLYRLTKGHSAEGPSYEKFLDCLVCHDGFSANLLATVDSLHRDGKIDTIPKVNRRQ